MGPGFWDGRIIWVSWHVVMGVIVLLTLTGVMEKGEL
jgi:hypothetical protein